MKDACALKVTGAEVDFHEHQSAHMFYRCANYRTSSSAYWSPPPGESIPWDLQTSASLRLDYATTTRELGSRVMHCTFVETRYSNAAERVVVNPFSSCACRSSPTANKPVSCQGRRLCFFCRIYRPFVSQALALQHSL